MREGVEWRVQVQKCGQTGVASSRQGVGNEWGGGVLMGVDNVVSAVAGV